MVVFLHFCVREHRGWSTKVGLQQASKIPKIMVTYRHLHHQGHQSLLRRHLSNSICVCVCLVVADDFQSPVCFLEFGRIIFCEISRQNILMMHVAPVQVERVSHRVGAWLHFWIRGDNHTTGREYLLVFTMPGCSRIFQLHRHVRNVVYCI